MESTIRVSTEVYRLLERRAREYQLTPDAVADTALRLQLGNTVHLEQRVTPYGVEAYIRGTRVAVRHVAAFLQGGHSVEEIIKVGLPQLPPASIYEAVAYYYDHQAEIEAELAAESEEAVRQHFERTLSPEQIAKITGQTA
jgi:uncharacterized protein (DUF433 family)